MHYILYDRLSWTYLMELSVEVSQEVSKIQNKIMN